MGAWGTGNFDNDIALDWVFELEETNNLSLIKETVEAVFPEDYIDSDVGTEALISIEAIARLKGNFGAENTYAKDLDNWVKSHKLEVSDTLLEKSKKAVQKIVSDKSELYELWKETDDFDDWKNEIDNLESVK